MKRVKLLLISLFSIVCMLAFSSCNWIIQGIYGTVFYVAGLVDMVSPKPQAMPTEIIEEIHIASVVLNEKEDSKYVVTIEGAIKNAGNEASDFICMRLAFYDENGYVIDSTVTYLPYVGAGETLKVREELHYFDLIPTSVKVKELTIQSKVLTSGEKGKREKVELLPGETFSCVLGEDGLYHTTITGKVKFEGNDALEIIVRTALYDTDGYLHLAQWAKTIMPNEEREYVIEYVSEEEITSHKLLYGTLYAYEW